MVIDTLNWNPSLMALANKWRTQSAFEFEDIFFLPLTKKLFESHKKFELTSEQIAYLKYFMDNAAKEELLIQSRQFQPRRIAFIIGFVVFFLVLTDLIFIKFLKYKIIHLVVLVSCLSLMFAILYADIIKLGLQQGYEPDQPIKFSHKVHSGDNGTDCSFCHMPAKYGQSAGIPGVNICLNCHAGVVEGQRSGGFEISKLLVYKQEKKTIPWIRVNNLPDHVSFNHSSHVNGGVECKDCHGLIEETNRTRQEQELSMIWCLNCHAERKVNIRENDYYENYREFLEEQNQPTDSATVQQLGGWDCMNCHY
jgi:hypothetical protein